MRKYKGQLKSSNELITTYEDTRAGFVSLALERNRRAAPYIAEARALQQAALIAKTPKDLPRIKGIGVGLLTAAGLSDKALKHLQPQDKLQSIEGLIKNFLEPAGDKFVEELVFRFLLTRGDTLGGSMRNVGGALAQRKLTRTIISTLSIAGVKYRWLPTSGKKWVEKIDDDADIELSLRGLSWKGEKGNRTLLYNLKVPLVKNNVDMCLFNVSPEEVNPSEFRSYLALGELKGGIDPAGADEHWKTARTALDRIRQAFTGVKATPYTFFVGAAIENRMSIEIWDYLKAGILSNAANLNSESQMNLISRWLCDL